jgi:hypothetical protein
MIELRWMVPVEGERVLQYRQKVDITFYAGLGPFPDSARNMQWGEWQTVPMESERDPAYP